jgi:hypothetical protein
MSPPKKPVQETIPGTLPKRIKAIDKAATEYVTARDERMELTKTEVQKREALIAAMRAAGQTVYRMATGDDVYLVKLTEEATVKVKRETPPDVDEAGDGEGDDAETDGAAAAPKRPEPEW